MKKVYTTRDDIEKFREELKNKKDNKYGDLKKYGKNLKNMAFLGVVISLIGVLLMVNSIKSEGKVPSILGHSLYQVETGSMTPTLPVGSIILSKNFKEGDSLKVGDIVTFLWGDDIVTHRIVEEVEKDGEVLYKTKGDNPNNSIDPELLKKENILGRFRFKIPFTG